MKSTVLIIDDNKDILTALRILLSQNEYEVTTESNPELIPSLIKKREYNLILLDMNFSKGIVDGEEGFKWLKVIKERTPSTQVILITAYGDIQLAVKAMQYGAANFIEKPWDNQKILSILEIANKLYIEKSKSSILEEQTKYLSANNDQFIGNSESTRKIFSLIDKVAKTDANVLITGENGTGKDLIARIIHNRSTRKSSIFLAIDMGALPDSLFESELFGYSKGTFTGAEKSRIGRIEAANGGTLFLDEIGNIPIQQQSKLLRVLESREVTPLGSELKKEIDIRLICATNSDIIELVKDNKFRQDLLYRINTVEIKLPALRDRKDDIPLLVNHFLSIYSKKNSKPNLKISDSTIDKLKKYSWPGNIRELSNLIERAVILSDGNLISNENIALTNTEVRSSVSDFNLESNEKNIIKLAIESENGNLSKAAKKLGITRATLYRKMEKYVL